MIQSPPYKVVRCRGKPGILLPELCDRLIHRKMGHKDIMTDP